MNIFIWLIKVVVNNSWEDFETKYLEIMLWWSWYFEVLRIPYKILWKKIKLFWEIFLEFKFSKISIKFKRDLKKIQLQTKNFLWINFSKIFTKSFFDMISEMTNILIRKIRFFVIIFCDIVNWLKIWV